MKRLVISAISAVLFSTTASAQVVDQFTPVKVEIDSGVLVGNAENNIHVFRGVPFAKPPVGDLRWKAAQKPDAWPGERLALTHEPPCPQPVNPNGVSVNGGGVVGVQSEDCLYLTAFAPAQAEKAPVVLWLYGGGAFLGAGHLGSFNGTSNAQNGVITFSINYRLGALANFNHPALTKDADGKEPVGNFALTDAVEALEWIQRNAEAFGGDPNNVTIAGQSAGGAMVVNLLSIPSAKGLYHKAVIESGAILRPGGDTVAQAEQKGLVAMKALGLPENATAEQLRAVSAQSFTYNQKTRRGVASPLDKNFRPVSTLDALQAGNEIDVPVMVGSNSGERGFNSARTLAKLAGDDGAGAWLYNFAYVPSFRHTEWPNGAIHSGELIFAFNSFETSSWAASASGKANANDKAVGKMVNSCWLAFYKMDAKAKSFNCANGVSWPAYTEANDSAMLFTDKPKVVKSATLPDGPPRPE